ncbi:MAG: hypothetical protein LBR22_03430 [Desulfovibrio sp.]|jgi:hypothetical protein|nr:hypothetical protein [Desulfovibrio sp.]
MCLQKKIVAVSDDRIVPIGAYLPDNIPIGPVKVSVTIFEEEELNKMGSELTDDMVKNIYKNSPGYGKTPITEDIDKLYEKEIEEMFYGND